MVLLVLWVREVGMFGGGGRRSESARNVAFKAYALRESDRWAPSYWSVGSGKLCVVM